MQTKQQKEVITKELAEKLKEAKGVVFSDFKGLTMKDLVALRKDLRAENISLKVVKKTLIDIALKNAGMNISVKDMEGQIAIAVSGVDEVAAAKVISNFAKTNKNLKVTGGVLEGALLSADQVLALSKLPSKKELLAKFVGTINAPVTNFVRVLSGNLSGLVRVLQAVADKK
ncbi:MAG: 50S ribosomal protein L10 [Candidatus Moraniibacteriota bacterium]|jgi:large subunit ribosomal protein L10